MAAVQPGVWGIDIGQCALKALRLQNIGGQVTATAFDYVEHPKILNQPDADPDQLTREALEKFLSRNKIKGDTIAMGVPGQAGLARFVKLPPVEEKKIPDIVKFEAKQQIPFNLNEVIWDYQKIGSGVVTDGFAMETEIGLFAIKREMVSKFLQHFKEVNVEVQIVQMAPLALCNFVAYDLLGKDGADATDGGDKECIVALDIGTDSTNLVITDGGRIIWQRPIPIGGNHFTRALTKDLKLTFAKAEHLKRNATKSPDLKKILTSLKPVLNDFVSEVQRSLGFFTNTHRDASVQYMAGLGGAFRLPGLQKFIGEKLQLEVKKLQSFERLEGDSVTTAPVFSENIGSFATAYGLALQGLKLSRVQTNLLPPEIQVARLIRSKKPYAATAAALLLIGTAVLTFGYSREHVAVASPLIEQAKKEGKVALSHAQQMAKQREEKFAEIAKLETAVKAVLAGQDERTDWVQLNKYINDCLPRLDGEGLTDNQKLRFWQNPQNNMEARGKEAYERLQQAQRAAPGGSSDADEYLGDLVQVNLEAVNARFADNLEPIYKKMEQLLPDQMRRNLPQGPGWIVEIRGWTFHNKHVDFIKDTLVHNLETRAGPPSAPEAAPATGAAATGAAATAAPVEKPKEDPIRSKISHVFLANNYERVSNPDPIKFKKIGRSELPGLFGAPETGTQPIAGARDDRSGDPRAGWNPVGGVGVEPAATPTFGTGVVGLPNPMPTPASPAATPVTPGALVRTEFIVMFVWKEPTPSDKLMAGQAPAAGAAANTPPGPGR